MAIYDLTASLDLKQNLNIFETCKQFDSLNLILSIFDHSVQADLSNYNVRLKAMKSDKIPLIQEHVGIEINSNIVTIEADEQLTTTAGRTPIELQFIDKSTGKKKATFNLVLIVVPSTVNVNGTISTATYTLLEELENKLDQASDFFEHIDEAIEANTDIVNSTNTANETKEALDDSNETALATKSALDTSNTNATSTKNALNTLKTDADNTKNALNTVNTTGQNLLNSLEDFVETHPDVNNLVETVAEHTTQLSEIPNQSYITEKAKSTDVNNALALKANTVDLNTQKSRIDSLVQTPNSSFYQKSTSGTTGALLVVASGATTGQINLASVTPTAIGYTPVAGDYVLLVYGVASGSAELIDTRVSSDGTLYNSTGDATRAVGTGKALNVESIARRHMADEIFNDFIYSIINVNITTSYGTDKACPVVMKADLPSIIAVSSIKVEYTIRNKSNISSVKSKVTVSGTTYESSSTSVSGATDISHTITASGSSNYFQLYVWGITAQATASFSIENIKITINNDTTIAVTLEAPAIAFATGTVNKTTKTYSAIAKKSDIPKIITDDNWSSKKWIIYGDSISDDDFFTTKSHYYNTIANNTGISVYPYAVGGSGYACDSTVSSAIAKWGATNNVSHQIDTYGVDSPDFVSIEAGTNDWGFTACAIGVVADVFSDTATTFYAKVGQAIRKAKNKYPYAKLFLMTLLPRFDVTQYRYNKFNTNNNTMEDFNEVIRTVGEMFSIPVLDMYKVSQLYSNTLQSNWFYDSLHPSITYQTTVFANLVFNFMKSI